MIKRSPYLFTLIYSVLFFLSFFLKTYREISLIFTIILFVSIIDKLGKGIVLRELIAFHLTLVCLIMPIFNYEWFSNAQFRIWLKHMLVPEQEYFGFSVPAVLGFSIALTFPIVRKNVSDEGTYILGALSRIKEILKNRVGLGITIMIIGILFFFLSRFVPNELKFIFTLMFWGSFTGLLYVLFTPKTKWRVPIILLFVLFIGWQAISAGMFTIVAYMGITMFSLIFLGNKMSFFRKLIIFLLAVLFVVVLQSVKSPFRSFTWNKNFEGSKVSLFAELFINQISNPGQLFSKEAFFPIAYRMNQGFNVSLVMKRIPSQKPHDYGANLFTTISASFVPRLFWPDKPEAGGKFNMRYYGGISIQGWSTNVGPLGEAYGSFGQWGIVYMMILGLFIRFAYYLVFKISSNYPLIIFWLPLLFYQVTYSAETDTLQIFNSLIKASFFLFVIIKVFPSLLGIKNKSNRHIYTTSSNALT